MVCDFLDLVHGVGVEEQDDAVLLANSQHVLPADVKAADSVLHLLLENHLALDCVPLYQQLVLASREELVFAH